MESVVRPRKKRLRQHFLGSWVGIKQSGRKSYGSPGAFGVWVDRFEMSISSFIFIMESLILAQDERWRRA
jgi:hypothetical protein